MMRRNRFRRLTAEVTRDQGALPGTVYRMTKRLDNASLRVLDAGVVAVAWVLAFVAGYEGHLPTASVTAFMWLIGVPVVIQLLVNRAVGLYGPVWRYASIDEAIRVILAVGSGSALSALALLGVARVADVAVPVFSTPPVAALLMLLGCGGIRFQARLFALERQGTRPDDRLRALIVGAGDAGVALALELNKTTGTDRTVRVVGFIDDDVSLAGRSVRGLRVLGVTDELERVCRDLRIDRVLIALPDATREETKAIVDRALETDAQVKVLPTASELARGPLVQNLRDLDLTDLLGREHAPVDSLEIAEFLEGATVLITGAGGSIGSEIARQVVQYNPSRLLLLDRDESLLYDTVVGPLADAEPLLADICDQARLREIFERYRPSVVFHAAAHKHVPLLERHPVEAIRTNVLGTWWLACTAAQHGCGHFVHISTDKAASPCSVMGATKRAAEHVVFEVGRQFGLPFVAVRFGNVLGSRGSVVPTFLRQILEGGPVTVTSPDMTRYFMTIPEAVSLVLQSGAMADEGRIFLLDMGEPVSIVNLARQMIRLAGLRPEDIEIAITGPRPGERLHEQLHDEAEVLEPTSHRSISGVVPRTSWDRAELESFLHQLEVRCAEAADRPAAALLEQMLRRGGVDCRLQLDRSHQVLALDDLASGTRTSKMPALLGGRASFSPSLPFARPLRPSLERVVRRYRPSYEKGMLTNGRLVTELEECTAQRFQVGHVVAMSSCTTGLMLTVQALTENRPGPVVLPSFTFSASAHAVAWNGRVPRFADCDPGTFQIDLATADELLEGASALMATHVFGAPCDPLAVEKMAASSGIPVLFDAAHAVGALCDGRPVGSFGDAEVFSLTPTKVLVAGEGGLVATNDPALAARLRIGRDYANPGDYDTRFVGINGRMSEFHAAMALESLAILDQGLQRRRQLADLYRERLAPIPGIRPQEIDPADESTFKDFTVLVDPGEAGITRDALVRALSSEGIETRNYFDPPVHRQWSYRDVDAGELPATDVVSSRVVSLPIYPGLRDDDVERVAEAVFAAHEHAEQITAHLEQEPAEVGAAPVHDRRPRHPVFGPS